MGYLYGEEPHFARSFHQTLRRNFLCFRNVTGLRKGNNYLLSRTGNTDKTPVYFDMSFNYTVDDIGAKSVLIKTLGNEKMQVTVMLMVLADGIKLLPYVMFNRKTVKETAVCQTNSQVSIKRMDD
jgi:hypothetical protein